MGFDHSLCHATTAQVAVPTATAFAYLADPLRLGRWALGAMHTRATDTAGVVQGESLFDGSRSLVRVDANPERGLIDYHLGDRPAGLAMRISARVLGGADFGFASDSCLVTLTAWRPASMDDARWQRLRACHEVEILLIKEQLEQGASGQTATERA